MLDFIMGNTWWLLSFLTLGACVGFIAGLLGVGGGAVMVPILTSLFLAMGIETERVLHLALGTSMMAIVITSFSSAKAHYKHKVIRWDLAKRLAPGVIIGTGLGIFFVGQINAKILSFFFSIFVLIISYGLFFSSRKNRTDNVKNVMNPVPWCFSSGLIIGFVSALISIGGGSLTVPYLSHYRIAVSVAIATSSAIGFVISVTGSLAYIALSGIDTLINEDIPGALGYIYLPAALSIGLASLSTAKYGAALAHYLPEQKLKRAFSLLLAFLAVNMAWAILGT